MIGLFCHNPKINVTSQNTRNNTDLRCRRETNDQVRRAMHLLKKVGVDPHCKASGTPTLCTFSHIGLSVPDLDKAIKFYGEVLGFYVIMQPTEVIEVDSDIGQLCSDVFGAGWGRMSIAHLATADRIGFELFEFERHHALDENLKFRQHGTFHFVFQDSNLEDLLEKIVAASGKQRMPVREYSPNEKPYRMVYVEDPFGTVFELYSHSYELTYSNGVYS
jgi:lactoylglutathione lyase family protein